MRIVAIIQARMGSSRLPGKVMKDISGEPMLVHVVRRVLEIPMLSEVVVASSTEPRDDVIEAFCVERKWKCFRGSELDALDRYYQAARKLRADQVVRVTADSPMIDPVENGRMVKIHVHSNADCTNCITSRGSGMPIGTGCEVFTFKALKTAWNEATEKRDREGVDDYIFEHPEKFCTRTISTPAALRRPEVHLTVDTPEDLEFMRQIYKQLYKPGMIIPLEDVLDLLKRQPSLLEINHQQIRRAT